MRKSGELTREQVYALDIYGMAGLIIYNYNWAINISGRAGTIAVFTGYLLAIPMGVWLFKLGRNCPGGTVFDLLELGVGKLLSAIIIILYMLITLTMSAVMMNMSVGSLNTFLLPNTPTWVIILLIVSTAVVFLSKGIYVLGKLAEIVVVTGITIFFISIAFGFDSFNIKNIIPLMDATFSQFIRATLFSWGIGCECVMLFMVIIGLIPKPHKHYMWYVRGTIYWSIILLTSNLIVVSLMSTELIKRLSFTAVLASAITYIGEYIQGLEILNIITFQTLIYLKTPLYIYCIWVAFQKLFNNRKSTLQLIAISLVVYIISVWINSYNTAYFISVFLGSYVLLPFSFTVLLLAAVGIGIKRKSTGVPGNES